MPYRGEVSVFVLDGLAHSRIWAMGASIRPDRTLYGVAELDTGTVERAGLEFVRDDRPMRHGNIVGWPAEKDAVKALALELALQARLDLPPP